MVLLKHELRRGRLLWLIWSAAVALLLGVCVLVYPQMAKQMGAMTKLFAGMGAFSAAFGMDRIDFGTFTGFFAVECGNVLGLGGACYAALLGAGMLSKEESEHTAEFLLSHPWSRRRIVGEKLGAMLLQVLAFHLLVGAVTLLSALAIGAFPTGRAINLLLLANLLLHCELALFSFGLSAFLRRGSLGVGLGVSLGLYFVNLLANLSKSLRFLKFLTPFAYADGADILTNLRIDPLKLALGLSLGALAALIAFIKYEKKDITA